MTQANVSTYVNSSAEITSAKSVNAVRVSRTGRLIIGFIEVLTIILLAYMVVSAFYTFVAPKPDFAVTFQATNQNVLRNDERATYDAIVAFDPFYRKSDAVIAQMTAPESSLKITIAGLRVGADGTGAAIIDIQGDGQKLISLGEEITRGVTLSRIFPDRVEINRRGVRETVYMTKQPNDQRALVSTTQSQEPLSANNDSNVDYKDMLARIKLVPTRDSSNRRISGFRITEETPQSLLSETGLAVGDIIKSVNGSRLSSFERMQELSEELQSAPVVTIEIVRRGQKLTLTL